MAKVVQFVKESYEEMTQKVTWPTWGELQNSADKGSTFMLDTFYKSL
jgi:preprotein translocase subunit SecE